MNLNIKDIKNAAKKLNALMNNGLGHSKSLEVISTALGYHDWNTCNADVKYDEKHPLKYKKNSDVDFNIVGKNHISLKDKKISFLYFKPLGEKDKGISSTIDVDFNQKSIMEKSLGIKISEHDSIQKYNQNAFLCLSKILKEYDYIIVCNIYNPHQGIVITKYTGPELLFYVFVNAALNKEYSGIIGNFYPSNICYGNEKDIITKKDIDSADTISNRLKINLSPSMQGIKLIEDILITNVNKIKIEKYKESGTSVCFYHNSKLLFDYDGHQAYLAYNNLITLLEGHVFTSKDKREFGFPYGTIRRLSNHSLTKNNYNPDNMYITELYMLSNHPVNQWKNIIDNEDYIEINIFNPYNFFD